MRDTWRTEAEFANVVWERSEGETAKQQVACCAALAAYTYAELESFKDGRWKFCGCSRQHLCQGFVTTA